LPGNFAEHLNSVDVSAISCRFSVEEGKRAATVMISPWVNEPLPDIHEILCSRDLARLTRRPRCELLFLFWASFRARSAIAAGE